MLQHDQEGKSAIVVQMSTLLLAKAFATHASSLSNFGEFAVLVYYEVMKLASNYDRIGLVFDRYLTEKSLKEGTRFSRGESHSTYLKGILLKSLTKWLRVSSKTTKTRMN